MTMAALADEFGSDVTNAALAGNGLGVPYTNWDSKVSRGCFCDFGFFGADCSQREFLLFKLCDVPPGLSYLSLLMLCAFL